MTKREYPGYDQIMIENYYDNSDVDSFKMKIIKVIKDKWYVYSIYSRIVRIIYLKKRN